MKILQLASVDFAGVGIKLVNAINGLGGEYEARLVTGRGHSLGFQGDISVRKSRRANRIIKNWIDWADVVNVHNHYGMLKRVGYKPGDIKNLIITHHGSQYRRDHVAMDRLDRRWGAVQLVTTPELTEWGATWMPTAIPVDSYLELAKRKRREKNARNPGPLPIVCQAPSNVVRKNTKDVAGQVKSVPGVRWRAIVKTPHKKCLALKAEAWLGVDQFVLGLGVNGYEFMAMGVPVLAFAVPRSERLIKKNISPLTLPFVKTRLKHIARNIVWLKNNPDIYEAYVERGLHYVRKYHSEENVADRYIEFIKEKVL